MIPLKDNLSCKVFPFVTLILLALNCIGFAIELTMQGPALQSFLSEWVVVPGNFSHALITGDVKLIGFGLLTMLTASFLHGGWAHIIGNMIFLQAFGRSVEARMGSLRFAAFYFLACFAAWGLFDFSDPSSMIPALGASGAIAGVMGAYLALYPRAQFKSLIIIQGWPLWAVVPAWSFVGVWIAMQFTAGFGALIDPSSANSVAVWAHIGGALFGVIAAGMFALVTPDTGICYVPMSCDCTCNGPCTKKNHMHRFRFLRLTDLPYIGDYIRSKNPDKQPCDKGHDHDQQNDQDHGHQQDQGNSSGPKS